MRTVYMTREIRHSLDIRLLHWIVSALKEKEESSTLDSFQIFEFKDGKMINRQEEPKEEKVFEIPFKVRKCKVWAVLGFDEMIGEYWTVMYPSEY